MFAILSIIAIFMCSIAIGIFAAYVNREYNLLEEEAKERNRKSLQDLHEKARQDVLSGKRLNGQVWYDELEYFSPGQDFLDDDDFTKPMPTAYDLE